MPNCNNHNNIKELTIIRTLISVCKYGTVGKSLKSISTQTDRDYVWNRLCELGLLQKEVRLAATEKGRAVAEALAPLFPALATESAAEARRSAS